jgi:hypothetical protein
MSSRHSRSCHGEHEYLSQDLGLGRDHKSVVFHIAQREDTSTYTSLNFGSCKTVYISSLIIQITGPWSTSGQGKLQRTLSSMRSDSASRRGQPRPPTGVLSVRSRFTSRRPRSSLFRRSAVPIRSHGYTSLNRREHIQYGGHGIIGSKLQGFPACNAPFTSIFAASIFSSLHTINRHYHLDPTSSCMTRPNHGA